MAITEGHDPVRYDEHVVADRLRALPLSRRVLFACSCAERLMPAYRWFCDQAVSDHFAIVRHGLDRAWSIARCGDVPAPPDVSRWRERVEALIPPSDDGRLGSAVAENAVVCVVYALRAWETTDPQQAVWSARQVYEAGDVVVQHGAPAHAYVLDIDLEPPVQLLLQGLRGALQDGLTVDDLMARAKADGQQFLKFLSVAT